MELPASPPHVRVEHRATARFTFDVKLARTPRSAFELLTPEGERAWDPAWDPVYANVADARAVGSGAIFTTNEHAVTRVWVVDSCDRNAGIARYTVFTPGQNVTRIEVRILPDAGGAIARVSYDRTSLNANADAGVTQFAAHADMMQKEWQNALDAIPAR